MKPKPEPSEAPPAALVVFEHREARGVLRLLRPGFRHCFCLIARESGWLLCDPLKQSIHLAWLPAIGADRLLQHFSRDGRTALLGTAAEPTPSLRLRLRPLTCVEVVKRVLGLAGVPATTPWQLHETLRRNGEWRSVGDILGIDAGQR